MAVDWDAELLAPVMAVFGEGTPAVPSSLPTYMPAHGLAFQLEGAVFDEAYQLVTELADGSTATTKHPVLGVRASLFSTPPVQADAVRIPSVGKTYALADVQPDGHGHILLILIETDA